MHNGRAWIIYLEGLVLGPFWFVVLDIFLIITTVCPGARGNTGDSEITFLRGRLHMSPYMEPGYGVRGIE